MSSANCKINLTLTWSENWVTKSSAINQATLYVITDATHYVPVVTLLTKYKTALTSKIWF